MWAHPLATSFLMLNPKLESCPLCEGPGLPLSNYGLEEQRSVCCLQTWLPALPTLPVKHRIPPAGRGLRAGPGGPERGAAPPCVYPAGGKHPTHVLPRCGCGCQ